MAPGSTCSGPPEKQKVPERWLAREFRAVTVTREADHLLVTCALRAQVVLGQHWKTGLALDASALANGVTDIASAFRALGRRLLSASSDVSGPTGAAAGAT